MKGERESVARMGVQGVSSSAWLDIMNVPLGNIPLWIPGVDVVPLSEELSIWISEIWRWDNSLAMLGSCMMDGIRTSSFKLSLVLVP